jgi:sterol desaturase/sphingolipid hydroxylase (fatty acid hydroxylase superfamily)
MCLVPTITVAICFGELIFATGVAVVLVATSNCTPSIAAVLFCCGLVAFTLAEYVTHRFVLHAIAPVEHRIHHARPRDAIDKIFWQIWLAFVVVYLTMGGAFLAGALVTYAWYLFVHYCAHHNPAILPASLLKHHLDHHRFAKRNYGVTTKLWDRVFGTMLR